MEPVVTRDSRRSTHTSGSRVKRRSFPAIAIVAIVVAISIFGAWPGAAQSGRKKDPKAKKTTPGPIADPGKPPISGANRLPTDLDPKNTSDEVDENDVVRVTSNLIPIPATVVDDTGVSITGL